jgi:hypothetical protein
VKVKRKQIRSMVFDLHQIKHGMKCKHVECVDADTDMHFE